jgi:hypothetical protein
MKNFGKHIESRMGYCKDSCIDIQKYITVTDATLNTLLRFHISMDDLFEVVEGILKFDNYEDLHRIVNNLRQLENFGISYDVISDYMYKEKEFKNLLFDSLSGTNCSFKHNIVIGDNSFNTLLNKRQEIIVQGIYHKYLYPNLLFEMEMNKVDDVIRISEILNSDYVSNELLFDSIVRYNAKLHNLNYVEDINQIFEITIKSRLNDTLTLTINDPYRIYKSYFIKVNDHVYNKSCLDIDFDVDIDLSTSEDVVSIIFLGEIDAVDRKFHVSKSSFPMSFFLNNEGKVTNLNCRAGRDPIEVNNIRVEYNAPNAHGFMNAAVTGVLRMKASFDLKWKCPQGIIQPILHAFRIKPSYLDHIYNVPIVTYNLVHHGFRQYTILFNLVMDDTNQQYEDFLIVINFFDECGCYVQKGIFWRGYGLHCCNYNNLNEEHKVDFSANNKKYRLRQNVFVANPIIVPPRISCESFFREVIAGVGIAAEADYLSAEMQGVAYTQDCNLPLQYNDLSQGYNIRSTMKTVNQPFNRIKGNFKFRSVATKGGTSRVIETVVDTHLPAYCRVIY